VNASRDVFTPRRLNNLHADPLVHVRRILRLVAQDERLQAEKRLARRVAIEVDAQAGLHAAAAAGAARADADVAHRLAVPLEVARVVRVVQIVVLQRLPVARVDREIDGLHLAVVEERIGRGRGRLCLQEHTGRDGDDERERAEAACHQSTS
jgi:hypothetical protein